MSARASETFCRDSSILPTGEVDLTPKALTDTNDFELVFATAANFVQSVPTGASPLILQVYADGTFYEGQATTDASKNIPRASGIVFNIPVLGRSSWHFRASAATTTIKGKLLLGL